MPTDEITQRNLERAKAAVAVLDEGNDRNLFRAPSRKRRTVTVNK